MVQFGCNQGRQTMKRADCLETMDTVDSFATDSLSAACQQIQSSVNDTAPASGLGRPIMIKGPIRRSFGQQKSKQAISINQ